MGKDDLFDADTPEKKDSVEEPAEEFFFEIDDEESGAAEQDSAAEALPDEEMKYTEEQDLPPEPQKGKGGSSQRILLLVLLLVVLLAVGYFFMGDMLMTPAPEPVVKVEKAQPQKIKIPERKPIEKDQQEVKEVVMPAEQVAGEQAEPVPATPEEAAEEATQAVEVAGAAAQTAEKDAAAPDQQEQLETTAADGDETAAVQAEPAADEAVPVAAADATAAVAEVETTDAKEAEGQPEESAAPAGPHYILQVGAFVVGTNLDATLGKVSQLGFDPVVIDRMKTTTMTRLRIGAYPEPVAREKLTELQQIVPSAFLLHEGSQMVLYAGSYYNLNRARSLSDKLYQHEIQIEEESVEMQVPMKVVRFGHFSDSAAAKDAAVRAKQAGLDVLVVQRN